MSNQDPHQRFAVGNVTAWKSALEELFPLAIPEQASWTRPGDIVQVLRQFRVPGSNHVFLPGMGGQDLVDARVSPDDERLVEIAISEDFAFVKELRPVSLQMRIPSRNVLFAQFWLEAAELEAVDLGLETADTCHDGDQEYVLRANGGTAHSLAWLDTPEPGGPARGEDWKRVVRRISPGRFLMMPKASPYNAVKTRTFDAYMAPHHKTPGDVVQLLERMAADRQWTSGSGVESIAYLR